MSEKELEKIEKIAKKYQTAERSAERSKAEEIVALDGQVKRPAQIFAYTFGTVGALVLGTGMSLAMQVIGKGLSYAMPLGIGVGILGILAVSVNYFIHKRILAARKKKYAERILALSGELLND